jgi:hypothetical protein
MVNSALEKEQKDVLKESPNSWVTEETQASSSSHFFVLLFCLNGFIETTLKGHATPSVVWAHNIGFTWERITLSALPRSTKS